MSMCSPPPKQVTLPDSARIKNRIETAFPARKNERPPSSLATRLYAAPDFDPE
jgi:hypothetical protein